MIHEVGGLLVGAIGGYWVLERAETHKGSLRRLGRFLGWSIILISAIGVVCRVWCLASCKPGAMGRYCPFKSSMGAPAAPQPKGP